MGNIPSWLNTFVRFECHNSAIDQIIIFLWKIFHKPIRLVVLKFPLARQKIHWPRAIGPPLISNAAERVYCKIREIATFLEVLEFWSIFLRVCAHKHLPMCRGTTFLHIHCGPPYALAQITPLNPIFMGHRFNLYWHVRKQHKTTE